MKRVAVFISNYTIDNSPSIINFLELLTQTHKVTLFLEKVRHTSNPVLKKVNIEVINVQHWYPSRLLAGDLPYLNNQWLLTKAKRIRFNEYVAFDTYGFLTCQKLFPNSHPYYYSLELNLSSEINRYSYTETTQKLELKNIGKVKGLIIQSEEREKLWLKNYNITKSIPVFHLPVTYQQEIIKHKSNYLRSIFRISNEQKIVLHIGGVAEWFSCLEIAKHISHNDRYVLVFHGFPDFSYKEKILRFIKKHNVNNVHFTPSLYENISDIDNILASADYGIAWYKAINSNFTTAGFSSGKIPAYLRAGLPIITGPCHSFKQSVEFALAGKSVKNINNILHALDTISSDYQNFVNNCHAEYLRTYHFGLYKSNLLKFLNL